MKTYTITVKPNMNAFAAILRFDPESVIEFENGDESAEAYTITSELPLDHLIEAAPGLVEWDHAPSKPPMVISVMGNNKAHDLCRFFFDSLTGEPLFVEVQVDFDEPVVQPLVPADVPADVAAAVQRHLVATTAEETGLYGLLIKLDRFDFFRRLMWRAWNWYVAIGSKS